MFRITIRMTHSQENVRKELTKMIPASVISEIACYVFYDNHPRDQKLIDITICTRNGEVKEYYKRDLLSSVSLGSQVSEIRILRSSNAELFYLVKLADALCILSRRDELRMHQQVTNVERYVLNDSVCRGQVSLKIVRKDDAIPLVFDDNFENFGDKTLIFNNIHTDESLPILTHLMRKLTEAKYSLKCNERRLEELLELRQLAAFSLYQKIHPNLEGSIFKKNLKEISSVLNVNIQSPWIKLCNAKIVMLLNITNQNTDSIQDVHILLHSSVNSMVYKTKLFDKTSASPYWRETHSQNIKPNIETLVLSVIDLEEVKASIISPIEFNGVVSYRKNEKEYLLPFDNVVLSSLDTLREEFDVLANKNIDRKSILAIMATSEKTDLVCRHIRLDSEAELNLLHELCSHLKMERVPGTDNIVVHRISPYHSLHGVMVVLQGVTDQAIFHITLYTRTPSQVLAFIHYIHDAMPFKILITTPSQKITAKTELYTHYSEEFSTIKPTTIKYKEYATSILTRTGTILEYLDNAMIKMNESKDPTVQSKVGKEIDLYSGGVGNYKEFRDTVLEETQKAISCLLSNETMDTEIEDMVID